MELHDLCRRVTAELERMHEGNPMGLVRAKGELARTVGFLIGLVGPQDQDDPEKTRRLRDAAAALGITI